MLCNSDLEKEDQLFGSVLQARNRALDTIRQKQQQFILVASLIDRVPNLAGLARTCEVNQKNRQKIIPYEFVYYT